MESASPPPPLPLPDPVFTIDYQDASGTSNPVFHGSGELIVQATEPRFRFTGRTRTLVTRPATQAFATAQIRNVTRIGRRVQFDVTGETQVRRGGPFVFVCATPEQAATAAALLPSVQDADHLASRTFVRKLQMLPGAASEATSMTNILIALNVLAFVAMGFAGAGWIETASMRPYLLFAANNAAATTDGEWWRIVTCMFVHYGLLHLALNMWALYQTGRFVERLFGRPLFTLAYLGSGIAGSFTTIFWHGDKVWSAGASGAVFGVYGALLGFMLREKQSIPRPVLQPLMKSTLTFAGYNLLFGAVVPHIDNSAHIGGFAGGVLFGWLTALPVERETRARLGRGRLALGLVALAAITAAGVAFSPRFDYSVREELRWSEINDAPIAREPELVRQQNEKVTAVSRGGDAAALADWLEREVVPFYAQWHRQLAALRLTPGRETARRHDVLAPLLDAKLTDYRALIAGLRAGEPDAITRYEAAEQRAMARVRETQP